MEQERQETPGGLLFRVLYPYFLYLAISVVVQLIVVLPSCIQMISQAYSMTYSELVELINRYIFSRAMMLTVVSGVVVIPVLYFFYARDRRLWPVREYTGLAPLPVGKYGYAIAFGLVLCLAFNHLLELFHITEISDTYNSVEEAIKEAPFVWTLLASVVIAPLTEELVFRGLLYKRLRRCVAPLTCALISASAFGLTHGNLVQFIYAFIIGMALAFTYEKYKNLWAPVCLHACANLISITVGAWISSFEIGVWKIPLVIVELAAVYGVYRLMDARVKRESLETDREDGEEDV